MKTVFAALILLGAAAAQANPGGQDLAHDQVYWRHAPQGAAQRGGANPAATSAAATSAPELDPGTAIAGFALLLGGLAIVNGKRSVGKTQP
jgi:hypothetical protein